MSRPSLSRLATDLLAEENVDAPPASIDEEMRAVARIEQAIRARARRRRMTRIAFGAVIAAGVIVALGYSLRRQPGAKAAALASSDSGPAAAAIVSVSPGAVVVRSSGSTPLERRAPLEVDDRLVTSSAGLVAFALADASRVTVDADSEVTLASLSSTRRFVLNRGALRADVSKLGPGERFLVETTDTEVEVHGTSFRVALVPEASAAEGCVSSRTRVTVFEGVVAVRWHGTEERISAGSAWPAPCPEKPPEPSMRPPTPIRAAASSASASAPTMSTPRAAPEQSRALAEQNALFAEATTARRSGDLPAAIGAYDRLLAKYPDSFLAESAAVERMRLLQSVDPARAREAAKTYLARYPKGFARPEAERLAGR